MEEFSQVSENSIKRKVWWSTHATFPFQVRVMFGLMKKHVLRAIDGTRWASRETKREAEAKIDNLHGSFVGTDLFFNYTFLQNRYGQVDITSDFFTNVLQMFKHFRQNIYHFVNAQVDKDTYTWNLISYPFTVNAFHLQQLNSIGEYC